MSPNQQREALLGAYSSKQWRDKVKKMPEDQVTAIYLRLKGQGKV